MTSIALIGILSGMIFGVLGTLMRKHATLIVLIPIFIAPAAYFAVWRESLMGHCVFAHHFHTDGCAPMRALLYQSVAHTADAIIVAVAHIVVAFITIAVLTVVRAMVANADLKSPAEKEAARLAHERQMAAQAEVKKRLEEDMTAITNALNRARELRESIRATSSRSRADTHASPEANTSKAGG